ncbi:response regulator [Calderihabitans maritimus]|uniref:Stage 0 sporulation protein A homolog n=1 Tax=Calderihabitans maritimus TaxID=1246530 RepID=A0A1Z5HTG2_9FIRM|nr:response regulator transcription factor [Calderihabitans maritimus]GAW92833.1 response regulator containing a CheY-like receiver domain and an HTH DNA-binding domain [Calderihabitans maritimus]
MEVIKVLIADDHSLIREGLRKILLLEPRIVICGEASDGQEAVELTRRYRPDIVLMDINMPNVNGLEATRLIKREFPSTKVIVLTIHDDEEYVTELFKAGASGYVLKDIDAHDLIKVVLEVAEGKPALHPSLTPKVIHGLQQLAKEKEMVQSPPLTKREVEILKLIAQGFSNREIGEKLFISEKTVKNHITNIFRKIKVEDRTQAALYAVKHKLVEL